MAKSHWAKLSRKQIKVENTHAIDKAIGYSQQTNIKVPLLKTFTHTNHNSYGGRSGGYI